MNDEVKQKVAKLLDEASKFLVNTDTQTTASTTASTVGTCGSSSASSSSSSLGPQLGQTLQRAQSMLQASSSSGLFRRLNRTERLRASSPYQQNRQSKTN